MNEYNLYVNNFKKNLKHTLKILMIAALLATVFTAVQQLTASVVSASENTDITQKEYHEYTDEELLKIYEQRESEYQEMQTQNEVLQNEYEEMFKEEWFVDEGNGIINLVIPEEELENIPEEMVVEMNEAIEYTNQQVKDGTMVYVEAEEDYYYTELDEEYVVQGGKNDFRTYSFKVWRTRWYTGWRLWMNNQTISRINKVMNLGTATAGVVAAILAAGGISLPAGAVVAICGAIIIFAKQLLNTINWNDKGVVYGHYFPPMIHPYSLGVNYAYAQ